MEVENIEGASAEPSSDNESGTDLWSHVAYRILSNKYM